MDTHRTWIGFRLAILLLALVFLVHPAAAQTPAGTPLVLTLKVEGALTPVMISSIERSLDIAQNDSADLLVLELNTPGGSIALMNEIVTVMRGSETPIVVYVSPQGAMAGSAGTILTLAGHLAAMAPETAIGAASPVGSQGEDIGETMLAKEKEILRATVRSLAENRPPAAIEIAEQTIESAKAVSSSEALDVGLIDFIALDVDDLVSQLNGAKVVVLGKEVTLDTTDALVREVPLTMVEQALSLLTNPNIVFLLLSIGVQAILIEMSSPGGWVAGVIGVVSLALVVYSFGIIPVNLFGLIFLVLAFVLFIIDVKAPTHGALTAAGIGSFVAGSLILFNSVRAPGFPQVSVPLVIGTALFVALSFSVIVSFAIRALKIPKAMGRESMVGKTGLVSEVLDPHGSVQLAGEMWSAELAEPGEPLPAGTRVIVTLVEGLRLKVRKVDS
ncbi:MAG TPA: nodulation protein NfeD [Bellilinea sp.]|nr:nodulation protein NfeD [Bellilinea sp.]